MDYYVWARYYFAAAHREVSSMEIRYATGHRHGVRPTEAQEAEVLDDLRQRVEEIARARGLPVPTDVAAEAQIKTRSAH